MKVLVIGSGGREHALAWKLGRERGVEEVVVAPGNPGMEQSPGLRCTSLKVSDHSAVVELCQREAPGLIVVGPEAPLAAGLVDFLSGHGFKVFGPTREASLLESSKTFSKELMQEMGVPTAAFKTYDDYESALAGLANWDFEKGVVLKADSLAGGKGVVVTHDRREAEKVLHDFMVNPEISVKTERILIEEKLIGKEASAFALCDGENFQFLGFACDYKRLKEGDEGPNTGGMGGYSPKDWPGENVLEIVKTQIIAPILKGMQMRGHPFVGTLFVGLMISDDRANVVEFNVRFGDPETQVLMPLLEGELHRVMLACVEGKLGALSQDVLKLKTETSIHIVLASQGYPSLDKRAPMKLNCEITLEEEEEPLVQRFFAGVKKEGDRLVNSGGRVLGITALGRDKEEARKLAYQALERVSFSGAQWRRDIGL